MQSYGLEKGYRTEQIEIINSISKDEINALAKQYLSTDALQVIVVGDKNAILEQLESLNMPIIELSVDTNSREQIN